MAQCAVSKFTFGSLDSSLQLPALSNADDSVLTADTDFIQGIHEQAGKLTVYEDMSP